jgi:hypothetical protein
LFTDISFIAEWYFARSRQELRLPNQEKELWALILDNTLDVRPISLIHETNKRVSLLGFITCSYC